MFGEKGGGCPPSRSSTFLCWLSCHEITIWESLRDLLSADSTSTPFPQSSWGQRNFLITGFKKLFWFLNSSKTGPHVWGGRADRAKGVKPGLGNNNQLTSVICYSGSKGSASQGWRGCGGRNACTGREVKGRDLYEQIYLSVEQIFPLLAANLL